MADGEDVTALSVQQSCIPEPDDHVSRPETPLAKMLEERTNTVSSISPQHIDPVLDNHPDPTTIEDAVQSSINTEPVGVPVVNSDPTGSTEQDVPADSRLTTQPQMLTESSRSHLSTSTSSISLPIKEIDEPDDAVISNELTDPRKYQPPSSTTPQPKLSASIDYVPPREDVSKSGILTTEERIIYEQLVDALREKDVVKIRFIYSSVCRVDATRWQCYVNQMTETEQHFINGILHQNQQQSILMDQSIHSRFGEGALHEIHVSPPISVIYDKETPASQSYERRGYSSAVVPTLDYTSLQEEPHLVGQKSKVSNLGTYRLETRDPERLVNDYHHVTGEVSHTEYLLRQERQKSLHLECEITKLQQELDRTRQGHPQRIFIPNPFSKGDPPKQTSSSGISHGRSSVSSALGGSDARPSQDEDELWLENRRLRKELENLQRTTEKRERILTETQSIVTDLRGEVLRLSTDLHSHRAHAASSGRLSRNEENDRVLLHQVLRDYKQLSRDYDVLQLEVEEAWEQVSQAEERASKLDKELVRLMEKNELLRRFTKTKADGRSAAGRVEHPKPNEAPSQSPQRSSSAFGNGKQKEASQCLSKSMSDLRNHSKNVHHAHQKHKNHQTKKAATSDNGADMDSLCKRYDELQWKKREIETALSHIPATYSLPRMGATKRHTTLQKQEFLEKKLDRIDKELGSLRLKLRQANLLPAK